jgi:pimeloyl-ACP methyl ester carboxylesterase
VSEQTTAVCGREQSDTGHVLRTELVDIGGRAACVLDWGGGKDVVVLVHPNGFCAGLFDPIARALPPSFRPVAVDLLGHGRSYKPRPEEPVSFESIAADMAAALDYLDITRAFLVGCSLGGGVAVLLDRLRPGLASGMLLCEAGAFPKGARPERNPMADRLRRRRQVWPDRASMRAAWRGRGVMSDLSDAALDAYLQWGVQQTPGGQASLLCDPAFEAKIAELSHAPEGAAAAWECLRQLSTREVTIVAADRSFLPMELVAAQAALLACPMYVWHGGHLAFFADAARASAMIRRCFC